MTSPNVKPLPVTQAADFIKWLHDGEPFETCIIKPKRSTSSLWEGKAGFKSLVAGWFVDADLAAKLACQIDAVGIYVTLNPVQDSLLARAESRLKVVEDRTEDKAIAKIKNLLIDIDPLRPKGISSSEQEHGAALAMALEIRDDLRSEGWPEPIYGDSGNGAHLIYAINLPNDKEGTSKELVKSVLNALALRYQDKLSEANLDIDQKVFNPARLTKLYGTWTRKGDDTQARPHRLSKIIDIPGREEVKIELLQKLAATIPVEEKPQSTKTQNGDLGRLDVEAYLQFYGREVVKVKDHGDGKLYCLQECIFDQSHSGNESGIFQPIDGPLSYQCFHNTCRGRTWAEARKIISGDNSLAQFMSGGAARVPSTRPSRAGVQEHTQTLSLERDLKTKVKRILEGSDLTPTEKAHVIRIIETNAVKKPLTQEVEEWVFTSNGEFKTSDCHRELNLTSSDLKKQANNVFLRLVEKGKLTPCGDKRGCYRIVEESQEIEWQSANLENEYKMRWPFGLERLVKIYPGNIIVVAGEKNAGKSAFLYNTIKLNQDSHKVVYFNSESSREELKLRLCAHEDMRVQDWNFKAFKRSQNFSEAIFPNRLNIIDYFEITDNFYQIGGEIRKIHDRLKKGICVIAMQMKSGATMGRGGDFSREKARMYLTLGKDKRGKNVLKIVDGKIWAGVQNPNGQEFEYSLVGGWKFLEMD